MPILALSAALYLAATGSSRAADPVTTPRQRDTARQVAAQGVPLDELMPNAPDSYVVKRGDTLWDISRLYLQRPWRWPELWGMNLEQIRNPHRIYPGQLLVLDKASGFARMRLGVPVGESAQTVKLSPRAREELLPDGAISAVPLRFITPFLNQAVVFETNELDAAPRIVAAQEGRVMVSRGETAYVRGDTSRARAWSLFREATELVDPDSNEILGYEGRYVGTAQVVKDGGERTQPEGDVEPVPATVTVTSVVEEAGVGDRLAPSPLPETEAYVPRAPAPGTAGRVVSVYGNALYAAQNQIVSINRGAREGIERGHVLAIQRSGEAIVDRTGSEPVAMRLPDERIGLLFVFRVFDRVAYGLVLQSENTVKAGDRVSTP